MPGNQLRVGNRLRVTDSDFARFARGREMKIVERQNIEALMEYRKAEESAQPAVPE